MAPENQDLDGIVTDVRYQGPNSGITLTLRTKTGELKNITWPVRLQNQLEIIPYEIAFLNQHIRYKLTRESLRGCGLTGHSRTEIERELTVLTGPVQGRTYSSTD